MPSHAALRAMVVLVMAKCLPLWQPLIDHFTKAAWVDLGEAWRIHKSETSSRSAVRNVLARSLGDWCCGCINNNGTTLQIYAIASHRQLCRSSAGVTGAKRLS